MSAAPQSARGRHRRRLAGDNPAVVLTFVFIGALRRSRTSSTARRTAHAFLTPKQVSTTFLYAAVLGLIAAGQTLVMLTGGVDLSVATTATAAAFTVSRFGRARRGDGDRHGARVGLVIGLVNGIGIAIFRVNALIMTLGISVITLGPAHGRRRRSSSRRSSRASSPRSARIGSSPTSRTTCSSGRRSPR